MKNPLTNFSFLFVNCILSIPYIYRNFWLSRPSAVHFKTPKPYPILSFPPDGLYGKEGMVLPSSFLDSNVLIIGAGRRILGSFKCPVLA